MQKWIKNLNQLYTSYPALYEQQFNSEGFEWVDHGDYENSVISYIRKGEKGSKTILVVCNLTPVTRDGYEIGVPSAGKWKEVLNSDDSQFGGSGYTNKKAIKAKKEEKHGRPYSLCLNLSPLASMIFVLD